MSLVSSTSSRSSKYDVFLSFRGEDTRTTFTAHLYKELHRKNIETYMDDVQLERGDGISLELLRAIQKSKISVVIFSKSYASSRWCLDELVQILDCKDRNGQIVVPIFYHVDPSHVKSLLGTYGTDFAALEECYKFRMVDRVNAWRDALKKAANLSGFDSKNSRTEADLVEEVARDILKKLKQISPGDIAGNLVGIEERIQHIKTLLSRGTQDINIIGIWGMGGIGKTTLAIAIFNLLYVEFDAYCFLGNVREGLERHGNDHLKSTLYTELLNEENSSIISSATSSTFVSDRLHLKKVFIVLDDVNEPYQVEDLVGDHMERFGQGSVIIVTSRDLHVLTKETTKESIYEVVALNDDEALRLFQMSAFRRNSSSSKDFMELSRRVIRYASGIPLALKVLGSLLHGRSKEEWESELDKLKRIPKKEIQRVLQISYDNLDREEKEIFLDIACFLKGWDKDRVQDILDGCGFSTLIGIRNLINKSLVTVNNNNKLEMHDLIQDMGKGVDRDESVRLGCSRRLWNDKQVWSILRDSTATKKVEAIFYDIGYLSNSRHTCQRRCVNSESFSQMSNLRLLQIHSSCFSCKCELYLSNGLQSLPSAPSYFNWNWYPWKSLPSDFIVENLVELKFMCSQVERLWDGVKSLPKLKKIVGRYSRNLIEIPNLLQAPNLRMINLEGCRSLETLSEVPSNIEELNLTGAAIRELPSSIEHANKLKSLFLCGCKNLKNLSKLPKNITKLCLKRTSIKELPTTIEELFVLEKLDLAHCKLLKCLPVGIYKLKSLKDLNLSDCSKLKTFPDILEPMEHLIELDLSRTRIKDLPNSFYNLNNLQVLKLSGCSKLKKLPLLPRNLSELDVSDCECLQSLPELPIFLHRLEAVACTSLEVVPSFRTLGLQDWWDQCKVGLEEGKLRTHEELELYNCLKLDKNACNDIIAKSELRILRMATILVKYYASRTYEHSICLPGSEIPQRFDYQTEGSSINIEFALNQDKANLLGFIIGIVVELEEYRTFDRMHFYCKSHFKTNSNESYDTNSALEIRRYHRHMDTTIVNSDHIFIFYDHLLHPSRGLCPAFPCSNLKEASFSVYIKPSFFDHIKRCNVKKLGIRLLYAGYEQNPNENMTEDDKFTLQSRFPQKRKRL